MFFDGRIRFDTKDERECYFVRFLKPDGLLSWVYRGLNGGVKCANLEKIKVVEVYGGKETLSSLGVWDGLGDKVKDKIIELEQASKPGRPKKEVREGTNGTEPKKRGRKVKNPDNVNIPKTIRCCVCSKEMGTTPPQFRKQLEKSKLSKEDFMATYKCRSCRKTSTE